MTLDAHPSWLRLATKLVGGFMIGAGLVMLARSFGFPIGNSWASIGAVVLGSIGPLHDRAARFKACLALAPIAGLITLLMLDGRLHRAAVVFPAAAVGAAGGTFIFLTLIKWLREQRANPSEGPT